MQVRTSMVSSKWQVARSDDDDVGVVVGIAGVIVAVVVVVK